jgi:hypothetical protein
VYYTHVYYLAWCPPDTKVSLKAQDETMTKEIGDIGWYDLDQCLEKIRSTNVEKRQILLQASGILKNTCPIVLNEMMLHATSSGTGNPELRQDGYRFVDGAE